MKTDRNGVSTCPNGKEFIEKFQAGRNSYVQYDYRHTDGNLFSCIKRSLEQCRLARDTWLSRRG